MASPRIEYAVLPAGEGPGQDRCFTADGLVVVLDGASAIDPVANPDATEYVDTLGPLIVDQITETPGIDLRDALGEAIRQTVDALALSSGTAPSSTVSIVRWRNDDVDVLVLGDSPVTVRFSDGRQEAIVQHPQDHIASDLRRLYRNRLAAGSGYDEEHRAILAEIQRKESQQRNQPGGYFIAESEPLASQYAECVRWRVRDLAGIVICTDGAVTLLDEVANRLPTLGAEHLRILLNGLDSWESKTDPTGCKRPRSKLHDDKTLAIMVRS